LSQTRISLLTELLKSFTDKELSTFSKFIESVYFNEDLTLVNLFKIIRRYALGEDKFSPELQLKVYEKAYCEKPLNQKELTKKQYVFLNNKQHKLLRLAEQFLMIENFKASEHAKSEYLYETLIDRNQVNLYQRHLKSDVKTLNSEYKLGIEYYSKQYKLQEANLSFLIKKGIISKEDNYDQLHYYLDINYILEKLQYHLAQVNLKTIYQNKEYENLSLQRIESLLEVTKYNENPLIQIYLNNINLVETESDSSYQNLSKTLASNQSKLSEFFLRAFYTNLNNYCTNQIRSGNISYYKNLFNNYKIMYENNLLIIDNFMDTGLLKNVITVSCFVKEFDWAIKILEANKKYIQPQARNSVYFYNKGVISYNQKNYNDAQDWFLKVDKINDTYEIGLRIFILQCIFEIEQDYNDATKQAFESTKQFFKRNKHLNTVNKKSYLNFINIFMYLYQYKHKAIKMQLDKIYKKLSQMEVIYKKQWLLNKIETLK